MPKYIAFGYRGTARQKVRADAFRSLAPIHPSTLSRLAAIVVAGVEIEAPTKVDAIDRFWTWLAAQA